MNVAIYLRKSRQDEQTERELGEGSTLQRHRNTLLSCAASFNYNVLNIYEEVVSGESIIARPKMLELLKEIQAGTFDGVLVMDIQRLGRGDMEDQGLILKAFKNSGTKIITPEKIYDLNQEYDETFTELQAFLSRQEYKLIKKRLWNGRVRSAEEGNFLATWAPYGYEVKGSGKRRKLEPHPEQSNTVKLIFNWYCNERLGCTSIADRLNTMGINTSRGHKWHHNQVRYIIKNPIYTGKILWMRNETKKYTGTKKTILRPESDWIVKSGTHFPLIDESTFKKAQEIMSQRFHPPVKMLSELTNPLAGIIVCGICGSKMKYRSYLKSEAQLLCPGKCGNKGSKFKYVESRILHELEDYLKCLEFEFGTSHNHNDFLLKTYYQQMSALKNEVKELEIQKAHLYDLLEKKIYTPELFITRSGYLCEKIEAANKNIEELDTIIKTEEHNYTRRKLSVPNGKQIINIYNSIKSAKEKNAVIKSILEKVVYYKEKGQKEDNFKLEIYPLF